MGGRPCDIAINLFVGLDKEKKGTIRFFFLFSFYFGYLYLLLLLMIG